MILCLVALPGGSYLFAGVPVLLAPALVTVGPVRTALGVAASAATVLLFGPVSWLFGETLGPSLPALPVTVVLLGFAAWAQAALTATQASSISQGSGADAAVGQAAFPAG